MPIDPPDDGTATVGGVVATGLSGPQQMGYGAPRSFVIGLRAILAAIDAANQASIRLHARFGFEQVGLFRQVGFKFDRWLDVMYMEKLLSSD